MAKNVFGTLVHAKRLKDGVVGFVDVEGFLRSIHKIRKPEFSARRTSMIVHKPIDWSQYPQSAYRRPSDVRYTSGRGEQVLPEWLTSGSEDIREKLIDKDYWNRGLLNRRQQSLPDNDDGGEVKIVEENLKDGEVGGSEPLQHRCRCGNERRVSLAKCCSSCPVIYN